jgi:hypothetical protein
MDEQESPPSWARRAWLLVTLIGTAALSVFFFWSAVDEDSLPIWLAVPALVDGVTILTNSAVEIRARRRKAPTGDT